MAAVKRMRRQVGALMISSVVALGVNVISSNAKAEDDASRFTYVHGAPGCIFDHRDRWRDETDTCR